MVEVVLQSLCSIISTTMIESREINKEMCWLIYKRITDYENVLELEFHVSI